MTDIEAVLLHYGAGRVPHSTSGYRPMRCPFHEDRTASAQLRTAPSEWFRCFGCPAYGDAIGLVARQEGLHFREARRRLEEITGTSGVRLPSESATRKYLPGVTSDTGRGSGLFPPRVRH